MTKALLLVILDFTKAFIVEIDASRIRVGAILVQDNHLVAYFSKKFPKILLLTLVYVREYLYAIVQGV